MRAHGPVKARTSDAQETPNVPTRPSWIILLAVNADFVVSMLYQGAQDLSIRLRLCFGLRGTRHDDKVVVVGATVSVSCTCLLAHSDARGSTRNRDEF